MSSGRRAKQVFDNLLKFEGIEWLYDISSRAGVNRLVDIVGSCGGRRKDNGSIRMSKADLSTEIDARSIRQPVVQHKNVEMPGLEVRLRAGEGVRNREFVIRKDDIENFAGLNIVLNDEKAFLLHEFSAVYS